MNLKKLCSSYFDVRLCLINIIDRPVTVDGVKDAWKAMHAFERECKKLALDADKAYDFIAKNIEGVEQWPWMPLTIAMLIVDCQAPALIDGDAADLVEEEEEKND